MSQTQQQSGAAIVGSIDPLNLPVLQNLRHRGLHLPITKKKPNHPVHHQRKGMIHHVKKEEVPVVKMQLQPPVKY